MLSGRLKKEIKNNKEMLFNSPIDEEEVKKLMEDLKGNSLGILEPFEEKSTAFSNIV